MSHVQVGTLHHCFSISCLFSPLADAVAASEYVDTREGRDRELQCDSVRCCSCMCPVGSRGSSGVCVQCSSNFVELVNEDGSSDVRGGGGMAPWLGLACSLVA